ncbi:hypothetical protein [Nostoc sp. T09]|nr:hypothetical protein [Nostoc sp. T09]
MTHDSSGTLREAALRASTLVAHGGNHVTYYPAGSPLGVLVPS